MNGKCRGCSVCDGRGCMGELPGMGGLHSASTFINNFQSWESLSFQYQKELAAFQQGNSIDCSFLGVAPMSGVDENMGTPNQMDEFAFHRALVRGAKKAGFFSCIGDGTPDFKIQAGIEALSKEKRKGVIFMKPYPNAILFNRLEWSLDVASLCGLDIDSYHIVTMSGKAFLEKKGAAELKALKKRIHAKGLPFVVKGVNDREGVALMQEVKPDVIVVSNHGGRVLDNQEGIAYSLQKYSKELKSYCNEMWVDGGIRFYRHLLLASFLKADKVLIGRPAIQATAYFKEKGISWLLKNQFAEVNPKR